MNGALAGRFDIRRTLGAALCVNATAGAVLLFDALTGAGGFWGIYVPLWFLIASTGFVFPNATVLAMSPHGRIAGNASAVLGFLQFGVSAIARETVAALQGAQEFPTAVPMAGTIAICSADALAMHLLSHPRPTVPALSDEAEGRVIAAEH